MKYEKLARFIIKNVMTGTSALTSGFPMSAEKTISC